MDVDINRCMISREGKRNDLERDAAFLDCDLVVTFEASDVEVVTGRQRSGDVRAPLLLDEMEVAMARRVDLREQRGERTGLSTAATDCQLII